MANPPKKILIIEDEDIIIEVLEKKLKEAGYETDIARDGKEGIEKAKEIKPDLILLDIMMPVMDGFEVMENMNKDEELKDIPVLIVSNSGQPVELNRARELGADDWLIKTEFDPIEVLEKVRRII